MEYHGMKHHGMHQRALNNNDEISLAYMLDAFIIDRQISYWPIPAGMDGLANK